MKTITVSFRVSDEKALNLNKFIKDYRKFAKSKQAYVLKIIENFLISWDPAVTDAVPDARIQKLIELMRPEYLLIRLMQEGSNFKFKIEDVTNA